MLKFAAMAVSLCRQDLHERFAGAMLGSLWVFIWPLVQLLIYIIIFGRLMGARLGMSGDAYAYGFYIASGLLCWTCFANSLSRCSRSLIDKQHIIRKVKVNLASFPAAACLGELLPFAVGFCLLFIAALITGWRPEAYWLVLALLSLYGQIVMAFGLGLFFACIAVFARDVSEAVGIALQIAFWFTPIVYLPTILPIWLQKIIWLNPMADFTQIFQQCFILGGAANWLELGYALSLAHFSLLFGLWTLKRWRKDILDVL